MEHNYDSKPHPVTQVQRWHGLYTDVSSQNKGKQCTKVRTKVPIYL